MTTDSQRLAADTRLRGFNWRRFLVAFAVTLVALLLIAVFAAFGYARLNEGRILSGVSISGVQVSGLTPSEAKAKLQTTLPDVGSGALTVTIGDVAQVIPYSAISRDYNLDASIEDAMNVGREGNPLDQVGQQVRTMMGGVTITPTVAYDPQALARSVAAIVAQAQSTPVNASISFHNGEYVVTPASDGQNVDGAEALRQAIAALNTESAADTAISVDVATVTAGVSTPDAEHAVQRAHSVTSTPLLLSAGSKTETIDPQTLRGWIRLDETAPGQWELIVARDPIAQLVALLKADVDQPAIEAEFKFAGGEATAIPGSTGYELDAAAATDEIYNALISRADGSSADYLNLPVVTTVPGFSTEEAQSLVSRVKLLGTWTTKYVPSVMNNGGQNIRRPADLIDGTVVQPGDVFDFVGVAGPITEANGYGDGAAIVHGKTKGEGVLGGGLCSASTTMFNAALRAGFELGARRNHAYYISRYPVGLDATIWISGNYTQTMSFTNDTDYPIIIRGINKKKSVTFEVWGVDDGRTVSLSDPTVSNKNEARDYYEFTDTLPARTTSRAEYLADGFNSVVTRTVRDASGVIIHEDTIRSSYRKVDGVVLVGRAPGDPPAGTRILISQGLPPVGNPPPTPTPDPGDPSPPPSTTAPTAKFAFTPPNANGKVFFSDLSKGGPTSWSWDFGDGSTGSGSAPSHKFAPGEWTVVLTVSNDYGSDSFSKTVTVDGATPPPTDPPSPPPDPPPGG